jgi:hypothetical protein
MSDIRKRCRNLRDRILVSGRCGHIETIDEGALGPRFRGRSSRGRFQGMRVRWEEGLEVRNDIAQSMGRYWFPSDMRVDVMSMGGAVVAIQMNDGCEAWLFVSRDLPGRVTDCERRR